LLFVRPHLKKALLSTEIKKRKREKLHVFIVFCATAIYFALVEGEQSFQDFSRVFSVSKKVCSEFNFLNPQYDTCIFDKPETSDPTR
jgi:hypothetical protein